MKRRSGSGGDDDFREPGFWETVKEVFLGVRRPFDCIQVEVTSRCSGRCTYCPHTTLKDRWQARDMDMATFGRLWALMRRSNRVHLQGWGEPLLNPAFFEMAAVARKAGSQVSTTTCGLRMDPQLALRIVESGLDIVAFSLAGTDPTSNAWRCGVGFERVCDAVSVLQNVRRERMGVHLEIHFAYLMLASCMDAVRGLPALMQRLGVHAAVISTLDYLPEPGLAVEAFQPHEGEKLARAAAVLAETAAEARQLDLLFNYELPGPAAADGTCRENIGRSLFVAADGAVSPCVYLNVPADVSDPRRRIFGNVNATNPIEIWESPEFSRFRERLDCGDPDPSCRTCPKRFMK